MIDIYIVYPMLLHSHSFLPCDCVDCNALYNYEILLEFTRENGDQ